MPPYENSAILVDKKNIKELTRLNGLKIANFSEKGRGIITTKPTKKDVIIEIAPALYLGKEYYVTCKKNQFMDIYV